MTFRSNQQRRAQSVMALLRPRSPEIFTNDRQIHHMISHPIKAEANNDYPPRIEPDRPTT